MPICVPIATRPIRDNDRPMLPTKVAVRTGSQLPSAKESNPGDLFYQYEEGRLYYYDNKKEAYAMLTLADFDVNCIEACAAYDALGKKIVALNAEAGAARPTFINCRNCGAPVKSHKCEYCDTRY